MNVKITIKTKQLLLFPCLKQTYGRLADLWISRLWKPFFGLRIEPFSTLGAQGISPEIARHAAWIKVRRLELKTANKMVQKLQNNSKKVLQTAKNAPCVITVIKVLWESGVT